MKHIYKKLLVLLCTMGLFVQMAGCGTNSNAEKGATNTETVTSTPTATTQTNVETTYPVTVKCSDGTEVTIKQEPKKVISVAPNITELMYQLGASDKLVGRTDYCDYPSEAASVPSIGTLRTPDIEKIISLQPDLVVASTHFDEANAKKLTDAGIPVLVLYEEHNVDGVYTLIDTLGTAINRSEKAKSTDEEMKKEIGSVEDALKDVEPVSVYYVVGFGEGGDYTAGGDTFIGTMLTMAGGKNIAQDVKGWNYSLESLLEKDPKVIIVENGQKDAFMKTKQYETLTAVKEGNVYEIDRNLLNRQGYRNAEGVKQLAKILHPDKVK